VEWIGVQVECSGVEWRRGEAMEERRGEGGEERTGEEGR